MDNIKMNESIRVYEDYGAPYVFISYCHEDKNEVYKILKRMNEKRIRFWYDKGISAGKEWGDEIADRIEQCSQFLLFLSETAVHSDNVKDEIYLALDKNCEIKVVYLEEFNLERGLRLRLNRRQAIMKYQYSDENKFIDKLCKAFGEDLIIPYEKEKGEIWNLVQNNYHTITEISTGVWGSVYSAISKRTNKKVLVKYITNDESTSDSMNDVRKQALRNEKNILAILNCPYVPEIIDYNEDAGSILLIESYIDGEKLDAKKDYSEQEAVDIGIKVARILQYLQKAEHPIVHKDIKPGNLLKNNFGEVFLVDFGIARDMFAMEEELPMGTAGFAAPEQWAANVCTDVRTDIYGLGKTLYVLLSGKSPNREEAREMPLRGHRPEIHPGLERILQIMMRERPEERYQTLQDVISALEKYREIEVSELIRLIEVSNYEIEMFRTRRDIAEAGTQKPEWKPMPIQPIVSKRQPTPVAPTMPEWQPTPVAPTMPEWKPMPIQPIVSKQQPTPGTATPPVKQSALSKLFGKKPAPSVRTAEPAETDVEWSQWTTDILYQDENDRIVLRPSHWEDNV